MPGPLPDQTPVNFVSPIEADRLATPSCAKALGEASLDPEDFGSHGQVAARIESARARCRDWDERKLPPRPSEHERELARCHPADLVHVAAVSGADPPAGGVPCAPLEGEATDPATERGHLALLARRQAGAVAEAHGVDLLTASGTNARVYDEGSRRDHERARIEVLVGARKARRKDLRKPFVPGAVTTSFAAPPEPAAAPPPDAAAACLNSWMGGVLAAGEMPPQPGRIPCRVTPVQERTPPRPNRKSNL